MCRQCLLGPPLVQIGITSSYDFLFILLICFIFINDNVRDRVSHATLLLNYAVVAFVGLSNVKLYSPWQFAFTFPACFASALTKCHATAYAKLSAHVRRRFVMQDAPTGVDIGADKVARNALTNALTMRAEIAMRAIA